MPHAWKTTNAMYFVGGNDAKANNSSAGYSMSGGCTKTWWDEKLIYFMNDLGLAEQAAKEAAMAQLMDANGTPVAATTNILSVSDNGSGKVRITSNVSGDFMGSETGMIACVIDPLTILDDYDGMYEIIAVDETGYDWIDIDSVFSATGIVDEVNVGGASPNPWDLINWFTNVEKYTQEIWVNKDLSITSSWSLSSSNGLGNNAYLQICGFNKAPGDMFYGGDSFQSIFDARKNGVQASSWVELAFDYNSGPVPFSIQTENVIFAGFRITNTTTPQAMLEWSYTNGFVLFHTIIDTDGAAVSLDSSSIDATMFDCWLKSTGSMALDNGTDLACFNSIIECTAGTAFNTRYAGVMTACDNLFIGFDKTMRGMYQGGFVGKNNTHIQLDATPTQGVIVPGDMIQPNANSERCWAHEINSIIVLGSSVVSAFANLDSSAKYGDVFSMNCNMYAPDGYVNSYEDKSGGYIESDGFIDERHKDINPQLDSDKEPLNDTIRENGITNIIGDETCIGAIEAMNTSVIETAVQSGLTAQGFTSGRGTKLDNLDNTISSVKTQTDKLNFTGGDVKATLDSEAVKLSADGLDNVVVAEPTGDPSGWSFAKCLRWLIMRFMNKHTSDNFNGITVHKSDGTASTSQAVTESNGVKEVSKAQSGV